ncbi:hypothetical protein [Kiloniella antarctica]|uniref:Lipoprotein n=1 Tax=Kiloniella antarctica TaxID=1550907 RepID=A0ABW5BJY0_9PROT
MMIFSRCNLLPYAFFTLSVSLLSGCQGGDGDFDFKLTALSKSSVAIKSEDSRDIEGCIIMINGAQGFWHEPEQSTFLAGQSRVFSMQRFYDTGKRRYNPKVDRIEKISVNCARPKGRKLVFNANDTFSTFLN